MHNPRWAKIARDLWQYKSRTVLAILSIAVGVIAVGNIMAGGAIMRREMNADYFSANPAHVTLYTAGVDHDLLESLARVPGVAAVEGRTTYYLRAKVGPDEWTSLQIDSASDLSAVEINKIDPKSGEWPPTGYGIAVERSGLNLLKTKLGGVLTVETDDGTQRQFTVTGVVQDPSSFPSNFARTGYGFAERDAIEWLGLSADYYSRVLVRVSDANPTPDSVKIVAEAVQDKIEKAGLRVWSYYIPPPGKHPVGEIVLPVFSLLQIMGILALGLSAFLVINTVTAILGQQVRQIGMMKAVGARRGQITWLYLTMVMVLSALALSIAIPVGHWLGRTSTLWLAAFVNADIVDMSIPANIYITEIAVGLLVPLLATLSPVRSGTRISVRQAINAYGLTAPARRGLIDRILARVRGLPRPVALSLRNTFRRKTRLALTLVTLVMAGAIFISVRSVEASLMSTLDDALAYWNQEVTINFTRAYHVDKIAAEVLSAPGVAAVEMWDFAQAKRVRPDGTQSDNLYIVAPPAQTVMIQPILLSGRWLLPEDENAIVINTQVLKNEPDIKVGDELVIELDTGWEREKSTWKVVGIVKALMTGPVTYVNYPYFAEFVGHVNRATSVRVQTIDKDAASQTRMAKTLEARLEDRGMSVGGYEVTADIRRQIVDQLMMIVKVLFAMSVLLALVGTMGINVLERTREIGVLRAIGASDGAVSGIVITEGVLIGTLSWAVGGLLSVPLGRGIGAMLGAMVLRSPLNDVFSWSGLLTWLVVVVVLATVASLTPARRATSLTVRDVLAYEG